MLNIKKNKEETSDFLKSLGFPSLEVLDTFTHFDFTLPGRRVLLIGPMGSGKTEFAARVWRDANVAQRKSDVVKKATSYKDIDRRNVFFIRSEVDADRFQDYPEDALAFRSGYVRCGKNIARIKDSFGLEKVIEDNPTVGTYIIDEASFFDERLAYVVRNNSLDKGIMFIFPTLILNFRRDLFNSTARLMLDVATDVIPLTAYCEHPDCLEHAFFTYRYYKVDNKECPALYFDPLIIVGGDREKSSSLEPDYEARCDKHHFLPGKEYTYYNLKPFGELAARGDTKPLIEELYNIKNDLTKSYLYKNIYNRYKDYENSEVYLNSLLPRNISEKALLYLYCEQNLVSEQLLIKIADGLHLDKEYLSKVAFDNRHPINF